MEHPPSFALSTCKVSFGLLVPLREVYLGLWKFLSRACEL